MHPDRLVVLLNESGVIQKVFIETVIDQADQTHMHPSW